MKYCSQMCKFTTGKMSSRRTDSTPSMIEFAKRDGRASLAGGQSGRGMPELEAYLMG